MRRFVVFCLLFFPGVLAAQQFTVKGTVRDKSGERLPFSQLFFTPDSTSAFADESGRFQVKLSPGYKTATATHVGFEAMTLRFNVTRDTSLFVVMTDKVQALQEVVVTGARNVQKEIFESNRTSTHVLTKELVTGIPVLGGEADVIKTLQLLPGIVRGVEGSSDLFVRGGAADQNLVLLDDVPIYNTSHLFGFLSVFNPDVLDKVEAINGGFPAEYGGRLSSILNVKTKSTIAEKTKGSGDIGLIASRLYLEQPIVKEKASFWIAARRTYIDQVMKLANQQLPYYFYDLNGKLSLQPTPDDNITVSFYAGTDVLDLFRDRNGDGDGYLTTYESTNNSQSLQWNRRLKNNWKGKLSLIRSKYNYEIRNAFDDNELRAISDIEDIGARLSVQHDSLFRNVSFTTGIDWTRHNVSPNVINTAGFISELLESSATRGRVANEIAAYAQADWRVSESLQISTGLRGSMAAVEGENYYNPEPRFSARYALNENQAIKFSYSRMVQYIHRISNSAVSSPTDLWYPVTATIKPQTSHQVALAWQNAIREGKAFFSMEAYYKNMNQLIGYEEGTNLFLNNDFEPRLIQGKGRAYGLETLLRKDAGRFTGWISYSLSWSWRQFDQINSGRWFHSRYDRRHNGAVVMQYGLGDRWAVSLVWEFISGARFTPVLGQYVLFAPSLSGVDLIPVYSGINEVKLSDAHRLDAGIKFKSKSSHKFQWQLFAGLYNVYNRANPIGVTIVRDEQTGALKYQQPGLFGALPFISYGFKF